MDSLLTRRGVLIGGGLCTLAVCGVAGCASYGPEADPSDTATPVLPMTVSTPDIPVGGGKVYADHRIVITQPTAGAFKAFSAVCTHQGCVVGEVETTIDCPCHGSKFAIADGSVVKGPATAPLPALTASVSGSEVTVT
jgi:Rieske Fe-S protein